MRAQRRWADACGVRYDAGGYVRDLADNLRVPLSETARTELLRGSELAPGNTRPARIYSLCSSAALVVNAFDVWRGADAAPLLAALGVGGPGDAVVRFEEPIPTGLDGDPPTLDVAIDRSDGVRIAIESKYCEWLVRRPRNKAAFKDKYFPRGERIWEASGLPRCQALAEDVQAGRERFKHLHAAQLLKHSLGLAKGARRSVLVYLYFDAAGREAAAHRGEIERACARLVPEIDLRAVSYQALFAALRAAPAVDDEYLDYLAQRYFPALGGVRSPSPSISMAAPPPTP